MIWSDKKLREWLDNGGVTPALRAQMRDMTTENLLLWKALREAKGITQ